jgi:hypothetical protein
MKGRVSTLAAALTFLVLVGCGKFGRLITRHVKADLTVTLPVNTGSLPLKSDGFPFSTTRTIVPGDDDELQKYRENITGFEVTALTGRVSELTTDINLSDINLVVFNDSGTATWTFSHLPLSNGMVLPFDNTGNQWTRVNTILNGQKGINVTLSGISDKPDVTFNIEIKFSVDVTVKGS